MSTLSLIQLEKRFGDIRAVSDVNIEVADGEFLCILGPSGCGKSTALRMIAGFEEPTGGDIQIDGISVVDQPPNRRPTAMVFQKYTLWPHMRVYDNIAFGLRLRKLTKAEIDRQVNNALDLVGLPAYAKRFPSQLSGGEQQRIALARALVLRPKIILLDEPFSSLDALLRVRLREELRRIQRQVRITAIFVTHDQEEALSLADRIAVMSKGHVEQIDKPSVVYANPRSLFVADFIGAMNLLKAQAERGTLHFEGGLSLPVEVDLPDGSVTVALRPEDIAVQPIHEEDSTPPSLQAWRGTVSGLFDLGHYRKTFVDLPGLGSLKVYLSKSIDIAEGQPVALRPLRYLVYHGDQNPTEHTLPVSEAYPQLIR